LEPACTYLPYKNTGYFSKLVTDYLAEKDELRSFYTFSPSKAGLLEAVKQREKFPVNRKLLVEVLHSQYEHLTQHEKVAQSIALLAKENTYTVCTAHQPNLMTGYLYFIYKIIHAIKLAEELGAEFSDKHFVPVYYMGSEDNDLDELGTFRYGDRKFTWDGAGQSGAVGRMKHTGVEPILDELFRLMGPPGEHYDELRNIITKAYLHHDTIAQATQYLVNELFGRFGLIVIDPDDRKLKSTFISVIKDDVLNHIAYGIVTGTAEKLEAHYKSQAYPRHINLFYLADNIRERIEKQGDKWIVLNTNISWTQEELLKEIEAAPESFSPNVILRGLFQETILPDVAFIGGGAEVAYWLQLKDVFTHYNVFFPNVQLRQSVLWINAPQTKLREKMELGIADIFAKELDLIKNYVTKHGTDDWHTEQEATEIENILAQLKEKATAVDPTLRASAEAALTKMRYQLQVLEKKMLRAEKKKMQEQLSRISRLKNDLFPNNRLQERVENFISYYLQYGPAYLDILKDATKSFEPSFLVIENK
jgi:bacillithiol biosynthesis cysteine-adding enzyme BshC